jgi:hypothetical protein
MRRLIPCLAALAPLLAACVDPMLSTGVVIGPDGTRVSPTVSIGSDGGSRISYTP